MSDKPAVPLADGGEEACPICEVGTLRDSEAECSVCRDGLPADVLPVCTDCGHVHTGPSGDCLCECDCPEVPCRECGGPRREHHDDVHARVIGTRLRNEIATLRARVAELERDSREMDSACCCKRHHYAEQRVAELERLVEEAPHGLNASYVRCRADLSPRFICDCWKSKAKVSG